MLRQDEVIDEQAPTIGQKQGSTSFDTPMSVNKITKLSRDPFLLFVICGSLIFTVFKALEANHLPTIKVAIQTRTQAIEDFEAITGRKATPKDIADLEQSYIADELLFREALNMGVHLFDPTTRRSLIEIMRNRITASIQEPSEEELVSYYAENIQRYYSEPLLSFEHRYFKISPTNTDTLVTQLQSGELVNGDIFPHGNNFPATSESILRGIFGEEFLRSLQAIKSPQWQGPIISNYGSHYVRLQKRIAAKPRPFSMTRNIITNDFMQAKVNQAIKVKIAALQSQYEINIEP